MAIEQFEYSDGARAINSSNREPIINPNVTSFNRLIQFFILASAILVLPSIAVSQQDAALRSAIQRVVDTSHAKVGVAIEGLDFPESVVANGERKYPMQSTYKFPLALCVLHQIEEGRYTLATKVHIARSDLDTNTMSPMSRRYFGASVELSIDQLLNYCVSESDNIACDMLFKQAGGMRVVNDYVHHLGISEIAIVATERQMRKSWSVQYTNWCKPAAMLELLKRFYRRQLLDSSHTLYLLRLMTESSNSANRIKGKLPVGAVVAHKTGTSARNHGLIAATNDIGIVTLPNGRHFTIVVFVSDFEGGYERGENVIAQIARLAWDAFLN
jgi:beta-lactamase class A